jgi:signal transduction histidine kinase
MDSKSIAIGIFIILIFISLVILFCIVLVKLYIQKIKNYTQQLYQKDLDFQKTLTTTVIETQEQVLHNISQDLHDDVGQQLTVINLQLESMKLDSEEQQKTLAPVSESLGKLSQSIRSISQALNNQLVVQQDLLKAIATEMERLQKITKMAIAFSLPIKTKKAFTDNEKIIIFRIFQEGINNCLKHANATALDVTVTIDPIFVMNIIDNGKGFTPKDTQGKLSLGLTTMHSRAESIHYQLAIHSPAGKGTMLTLTENKTT